MLRFIFRILFSEYNRPKPVIRKDESNDSDSNGDDLSVGELVGRCYVIDGDTIVIKKTHIRLFGIDAPELDQPYGQKAKSALINMCKGEMITAIIVESDHYDRLVAKCSLPDGTDLSAAMVGQGLALDWAKFSGGTYRHLEAPDARKKMWRVAARHQGKY